jgi:hypothetical protein
MRIVSRFLWWPLTIDGETRWLETVGIQQSNFRLIREDWENKSWVVIEGADDKAEYYIYYDGVVKPMWDEFDPDAEKREKGERFDYFGMYKRVGEFKWEMLEGASLRSVCEEIVKQRSA